MCSPRRLIVIGVSSDGGRNLIGRRTESDRVADGNRSGGGRNLIGRRTQSDRVADGNRLGGGRNPIGWRTESNRVAGAFKGVHLSQVHRQSNIDTPLILLVQFLLAWLVQFLLAWLVHLRQVHPLKKTQRNRNNIAAGHTVMSDGYTLLYIVPSGGALEIF